MPPRLDDQMGGALASTMSALWPRGDHRRDLGQIVEKRCAPVLNPPDATPPGSLSSDNQYAHGAGSPLR
jgi:hypothetical protein